MTPNREQAAAALSIVMTRLTADVESLGAGRMSTARIRDLADLLEDAAHMLREHARDVPAPRVTAVNPLPGTASRRGFSNSGAFPEIRREGGDVGRA